MVNNYSVAVLMSTYNGENFLEEQIRSIMRQELVKIHLFVRDDGSSDRTNMILNKMKHIFPNAITIQYGKNIGYAKSYFELMKLSTVREFQYIAFADQDDVWANSKIYTLLNAFKYNSDVPQIAFSNGNVIKNDEKKGKLYYRIPSTKSIISVRYRAFYGMTFLINYSLLNVILSTDLNSVTELGHDDWIMMVAVNTGKISYVDHTLIDYRQHNSNASGIKSSARLIGNVSKIIKVLSGIRQRLSHWAFVNSFNAQYVLERIPKEYILDNQLDFLYQLSHSNNNTHERIKLLFSNYLTAGSFSQDIILKILLILKKI